MFADPSKRILYSCMYPTQFIGLMVHSNKTQCTSGNFQIPSHRSHLDVIWIFYVSPKVSPVQKIRIIKRDIAACATKNTVTVVEYIQILS